MSVGRVESASGAAAADHVHVRSVADVFGCIAPYRRTGAGPSAGHGAPMTRAETDAVIASVIPKVKSPGRGRLGPCKERIEWEHARREDPPDQPPQARLPQAQPELASAVARLARAWEHVRRAAAAARVESGFFFGCLSQMDAVQADWETH